MERVVFFGAGEYGYRAYWEYKDEKEIVAFLDNDSKKWGGMLKSIPIIGIEEFKDNYHDCKVMITCSPKYVPEISTQLEQHGINDYRVYEPDMKEIVISYSGDLDREDLILFHALHDVSGIFYIDVGSNDPSVCSVTKLFYDQKNAHGINIDPIYELMEKTRKYRTKDINICAGVGDKDDSMTLYMNGGLSTLVEANANEEQRITREIKIVTLKNICNQFISRNQDIHFLKIDVEGFEKQVLMGMDFLKYRPWIVVMESTKPCTLDFIHDEWEYILLENNYHYVMTCGVNRYYVANERSDFDERFIPIEEIRMLYDIFEIKRLT